TQGWHLQVAPSVGQRQASLRCAEGARSSAAGCEEGTEREDSRDVLVSLRLARAARSGDRRAVRRRPAGRTPPGARPLLRGHQSLDDLQAARPESESRILSPLRVAARAVSGLRQEHLPADGRDLGPHDLFGVQDVLARLLYKCRRLLRRVCRVARRRECQRRRARVPVLRRSHLHVRNLVEVTGRFAPSPTGPLHLGSLVAALGSYLFAKRDHGRWLVRMEDLDAPRVVPGAAQEILATLQRYGLQWDGDVVYQSMRTALYESALDRLRAKNLVYDCGCSRAELQRAASAPVDGETIYPGTCRNGLPPGRVPRAIRFRASDEEIVFDDRLCGRIEAKADDFVVRRADGVFAYQLAVVVDDAEQGVTQVVRGRD